MSASGRCGRRATRRQPPRRDVAGALALRAVGGIGLQTDGLALGPPPCQPVLDPLGLAGAFLPGDPSGERHREVLHLARAVEPRLLNADHDDSGLPEQADDPQGRLRAALVVADDPVQGPHDQHLELGGVCFGQGLFQGAPVLPAAPFLPR